MRHTNNLPRPLPLAPPSLLSNVLCLWRPCPASSSPYLYPALPLALPCAPPREKMKSERLSLSDGALMRTLVDFPGGLELHIGVRAVFFLVGG